MKKLLAVITASLMLLGCIGPIAFAEGEPLSANVYVTVANKGTLTVARERITVTDIDNDNALTINDALYCTHEAKYDGGAQAGYASAYGQYGLSLNKLWGDNSGNFYYYVNNASAWSLADAVKDGDYVYAFVYSDGEYFSDAYCWFDVTEVKADANEEIKLTLSGIVGYDSGPIIGAVEGATVTVNGEKTEYKTDKDGKVTLKISNGSKCVISAVSDTATLVPPVCIATVASPDTAEVYVTVSDKDGKLALAQEKITVTDTDKDGYLTVNDALFCAHEAKYEGGAQAGYASAYGAYGLSLTKLWGTANGGSYGYYVNNKSAWSLADTVKNGDYVNAFVYTDLTAWSDTYCMFNVNTASAKVGGEINLTLTSYNYDTNGNLITVPVGGATVTVNGEKTAFKTDKNGTVTITLEKEGAYVISAVSDTQLLVPPVCKATVTAASVTTPSADNNGNSSSAYPKTGDNSSPVLFIALMLLSAVALPALSALKKKTYEK